DSVSTAVGLDAPGRTELDWFEIYGPLIAVLVGLVALISGIVLVRRRGDQPEDAGAEAPEPALGPAGQPGAPARPRARTRFQVRSSRSTGTGRSGRVQPGRYRGTASTRTAPCANRAQARAALTETGYRLAP